MINMQMQKRQQNALTEGFTIMELMVVIIIIAVLVSLLIPNFIRTRERALDKEAQTALRLIQAAERIYQAKVNEYVAGADTAAVNANLQLNLASGSWTFAVPALTVDNTANPQTFTATAGRTIGIPWRRTWNITQDTAVIPACEEIDSGSCPP